jgi:hypothetical protein
MSTSEPTRLPWGLVLGGGACCTLALFSESWSERTSLPFFVTSRASAWGAGGGTLALETELTAMFCSWLVGFGAEFRESDHIIGALHPIFSRNLRIPGFRLATDRLDRFFR